MQGDVMGGTRGIAVVVALAAAGALASCEVPPPRPSFVVDAFTGADDASPGDGVCETAAGNGTCPFRAALQEANALGYAEIVLPAGVHDDLPDVAYEVTGDLRITGPGGGELVTVEGSIRVEAGGALHMADLAFEPNHPLVTVAGRFVGQRLAVVTAEGAVVVEAGGSAFVDQSILVSALSAPVVNHGRVIVRSSYLLGDAIPPELGGGSPPALDTRGSGTTHVVGSVLQSEAWRACEGTAPSSGGHNAYVEAFPALDSCALAGAGDVRNVALGTSAGGGSAFPWSYALSADSPLVDAIPVGSPGCGGDAPLDVFGAARPVDGDGDGTAACDIGPVERPGG
jgi:hypothetical protein